MKGLCMNFKFVFLIVLLASPIVILCMEEQKRLITLDDVKAHIDQSAFPEQEVFEPRTVGGVYKKADEMSEGELELYAEYQT